MHANIITKPLIIGMIAYVVIFSALSAEFHPDRQSMGLKGPVENYREFDSEGNVAHFHFTHSGDLDRYWYEGYEYYNNSEPPVTYQRIWNPNGWLVSILAITDTSDTLTVCEYGYSSDGKLEFSLTRDFHDDQDELLYSKTMYDSLGRPVQRQDWDEEHKMSSRTVYTYNDLGKLAREELWAGISCDELQYFVNYSYDEEGYLTFEEGDIWWFEYAYNSDGSLKLRQYVQDIDIRTQYYRYDEFNRLVEVVESSEDDESIIESYSYDARGNITYEYVEPWVMGVEYEYDYYE